MKSQKMLCCCKKDSVKFCGLDQADVFSDVILFSEPCFTTFCKQYPSILLQSVDLRNIVSMFWWFADMQSISFCYFRMVERRLIQQFQDFVIRFATWMKNIENISD